MGLLKRRRSEGTAGLSGTEILALYRERWEDVLRFIARRVLVPEVAADLTAETFAKAYINRKQFDERKGEPGAWLYGIARHEVSSYLRTLTVERRARERLGVPEQVLSPSDAEQIEALIDFDEVGRRLQSVLAEIPADQRDAVVYRIVDGLSYDEIARRLGCSQPTARARVSRGLRNLGHALNQIPPTSHGASS